MAHDEQMASRFRKEFVKLGLSSVREKSMFGALGFMINGKLTVCVGNKDVMYKLGAARCEELTNQGIAAPVVMGKRTMRDWVNIQFSHLENPDEFEEYLLQSLELNTKPIIQ